MNAGRRRRRISPYRRIASTLVWVVGAAVVLVVVLIATGRSAGASVAVALAGAGVVAVVVGAIELTGALRSAPVDTPPRSDTTGPDDDATATESPRP